MNVGAEIRMDGWTNGRMDGWRGFGRWRSDWGDIGPAGGILSACNLTSSASQHDIDDRRGLNVIILQSLCVFQLTRRRDESLLIGRNTRLLFNFSFYDFHGVV